ncbi:hypothetical protein Salat_1369300 [Sesamum alatum]|uniref:Uncharacterized protein n=1 Tax=Sesamum alatum TaxID=300844 RepID=A0AAE1Y982_9LAMI|nr:hypothetical protein Salat_1369300 [Sesamum alatum]
MNYDEIQAKSTPARRNYHCQFPNLCFARQRRRSSHTRRRKRRSEKQPQKLQASIPGAAPTRRQHVRDSGTEDVTAIPAVSRVIETAAGKVFRQPAGRGGGGRSRKIWERKFLEREKKLRI